MAEIYRPDGRGKDQPIVEVSDRVIARLGEPTVNYDQLDELFRRDLRVDNSITPSIDLYHDPKDNVSGYFLSGEPIVHVQPVFAQEDYGQYGPMRVVMHEGKHLSDSIHHKNLMRIDTYAPFVVGAAATAFAIKGTPMVLAADLIVDPLVFASSTLLSKKWLSVASPAEKRAYKFENNREVFNKYKSAIVFDGK